MKERGKREGLIVRVGEMMSKTRSRIRAGGVIGEKFWTARKVRQGYPLLFNIVMAGNNSES